MAGVLKADDGAGEHRHCSGDADGEQCHRDQELDQPDAALVPQRCSLLSRRGHEQPVTGHSRHECGATIQAELAELVVPGAPVGGVFVILNDPAPATVP